MADSNEVIKKLKLKITEMKNGEDAAEERIEGLQRRKIEAEETITSLRRRNRGRGGSCYTWKQE